LGWGKGKVKTKSNPRERTLERLNLVRVPCLKTTKTSSVVSGAWRVVGNVESWEANCKRSTKRPKRPDSNSKGVSEKERNKNTESGRLGGAKKY